MDETPVDYLAPGHAERPNRAICGRAAGPVVMCFTAGKPAGRRNALGNIIPCGLQRNGAVSDGYSAYRAFANRATGTIELAGCWAHVRRKFHEALEQSPKTAGWMMRHQHLYRVEASLREQRATAPDCAEPFAPIKAGPSSSVCNAPWSGSRAADAICPRACWASPSDYALGQWKTLEVYLADGRVEIDNNLVENAIRPTAPRGQKNWLLRG